MPGTRGYVHIGNNIVQHSCPQGAHWGVGAEGVTDQVDEVNCAACYNGGPARGEGVGGSSLSLSPHLQRGVLPAQLEGDRCGRQSPGVGGWLKWQTNSCSSTRTEGWAGRDNGIIVGNEEMSHMEGRLEGRGVR